MPICGGADYGTALREAAATLLGKAADDIKGEKLNITETI